MDFLLDIPIPLRSLYTLILRTVASRELFISTLTNMILIYTPRNSFNLVPSWSNDITLDSTNQALHHLTQVYVRFNIIGHWRFTICLIRAPYHITPPPSRWDFYEHHYSRWSYIPYYLYLPSTFNIHHHRPISHRRPQKHVRSSHRKLRAFTCLYCYPTAPG